MKVPSYADSFEVLCLQAADDGRGPVLFGESFERARKALRPFMVGKRFPDVYLEFPLIGEPFMDVTVLLKEIEPGTRIDSPAAAGTEAMLEWYADAHGEHQGIACGYEVDTKEPGLPAAAVHFQPRKKTQLVEPFCKIVGEPERAALYLDLDACMPEGWPLSFFGMFRGRPGSPLRVCGYLARTAQSACACDPEELGRAFRAIGFTAYDNAMLAQVSQLMAVAPGLIDFQFDIYPDGSLGDTFAIDLQFEIAQPKDVQACFTDGGGANVMNLLEKWGAADERWHLGAEAAFANAIPAWREDGSICKWAFTLMPQWAKARWKDGVLQPSKLYLLGSAGPLENE